MQKKVKIKFNSIQNDREITCMQSALQKRMNFKSNSMHLHADGRAMGGS